MTESINIPILSDIHFGQKAFNKSVFEMQMYFFEKQFFPWCLKHGVKYVLHGGDLFHNRNIIDWYIMTEVKKRFFQWFDDNGIEFHTIVGNHDSYYKSTIETNSPCATTAEFKNVHIYSKQTVIQLGKYTFGMVPWIIDEHNAVLPKDVDVILGHFEAKDFQLMKGIYSTDGFDLTFFKPYKLVLSGHYHIKSHKQNFYMVGTQYQTSWGDHGIEKGFYVLQDNFKMKYIDNTVSPRFVKLFYREIDGVKQIRTVGEKGEKTREVDASEAIQVVKKNYCKLIVEKSTDQAALDSFFTSLQARSRDGYKIELIDANEVIESFDFDEIEQKIVEESDVFDTIHTFVGGMTFDSDIDKDVIFDVFRVLYREAEEQHTEIQQQRNGSNE